MLFHPVSLFLPRLDSALQGLDMGESFFLELFRPTGGGGLLRSGAVKDQFLLLGNLGKLLLKFLQVHGAFEVHLIAFFLVIVGAHEKSFTGFDFFPRLARIDPCRMRHDQPPLS
jgi:hypothetical protein